MGANLLAYGKKVVGLEGEPSENDVDLLLDVVSSTGSKAILKNMSNYKFIILALRGTTSGAWGIMSTIPYKLFKQFNNTNQAVQVEFASSSVISTVHYVDDTHIYIDALTTNRGFSMWGYNP